MLYQDIINNIKDWHKFVNPSFLEWLGAAGLILLSISPKLIDSILNVVKWRHEEKETKSKKRKRKKTPQ